MSLRRYKTEGWVKEINRHFLRKAKQSKTEQALKNVSFQFEISWPRYHHKKETICSTWIYCCRLSCYNIVLAQYYMINLCLISNWMFLWDLADLWIGSLYPWVLAVNLEVTKNLGLGSEQRSCEGSEPLCQHHWHTSVGLGNQSFLLRDPFLWSNVVLEAQWLSRDFFRPASGWHLLLGLLVHSAMGLFLC